MNDVAVKGIAFVSVVVVHVAAVIVLNHLRSSKPVDAQSGMKTIVWFLPDRTSAPNPTLKPERAHRAKARADSGPNSPQSERAIATGPAPELPIDWATERQRAAEELAARTKNESETDALDRNQLPDLGSTGKTFRRPLHERGDSQHFDSGEIITWSDERNGRCYFTNLPATTPQLIERTVVKVCKPRRSEGESLEERATPKHLRKSTESP